MAFCPKCGNENEGDSKSCQKCGTEILGQTYLFCSQCGAENHMGRKTCNECGIVIPRTEKPGLNAVEKATTRGRHVAETPSILVGQHNNRFYKVGISLLGVSRRSQAEIGKVVCMKRLAVFTIVLVVSAAALGCQASSIKDSGTAKTKSKTSETTSKNSDETKPSISEESVKSGYVPLDDPVIKTACDYMINNSKEDPSSTFTIVSAQVLHPEADFVDSYWRDFGVEATNKLISQLKDDPDLRFVYIHCKYIKLHSTDKRDLRFQTYLLVKGDQVTVWNNSTIYEYQIGG